MDTSEQECPGTQAKNDKPRTDVKNGHIDHTQINGKVEDSIQPVPDNSSSNNAVASTSNNSDDNDEIITLDSYPKHSQEEIRALMVKNVVEDPLMIATFADKEFQKLIWMANRSFIVPNIAQVLEESYRKHLEDIKNQLTEHLTFDIWVFPLTISDDLYLLAELVTFDSSGQFKNYLMDCFPLEGSDFYEERPTSSERICGNLKEFKVEKKIGEIYVWDKQFQQLRNEISKEVLHPAQNVQEKLIKTQQELDKLSTELSEKIQILRDEQPEIVEIMSNAAELSRFKKFMTKLKMTEKDIRENIKDLENNEEKMCFCQHVIPEQPLNLFKFTRMISYDQILVKMLSSLEKSREPATKKAKTNSQVNTSERKGEFITIFTECQSLVNLGRELHQQFFNFSVRIRNKDPIKHPYSKIFNDVAARATTTVNVPHRLWMIVAFLRIWGKTQDGTSA